MLRAFVVPNIQEASMSPQKSLEKLVIKFLFIQIDLIYIDSTEAYRRTLSETPTGLSGQTHTYQCQPSLPSLTQSLLILNLIFRAIDELISLKTEAIKEFRESIDQQKRPQNSLSISMSPGKIKLDLVYFIFPVVLFQLKRIQEFWGLVSSCMTLKRHSKCCNIYHPARNFQENFHT